MAKKSNPYGTGLFHKRTKPKRKGRHSKRPNKRNTHKVYRGQGRRQYLTCSINYTIILQINNNKKGYK